MVCGERGQRKRLEWREKGPTETYSDMTFSYVDNHQELCFPIHEDKNVTCQSKGESPTIDQEWIQPNNGCLWKASAVCLVVGLRYGNGRHQLLQDIIPLKTVVIHEKIHKLWFKPTKPYFQSYFSVYLILTSYCNYVKQLLLWCSRIWGSPLLRCP